MSRGYRVSALFIAVLLLLGFLAVFQFPRAYATTLFSAGFESGDFSAWTGTDYDTGCTIAISSTIAHTGSYSAKSYIDGDMGGWAECYINFAATAVCYARAYYYFSSLPADGNRMWFHSLRSAFNIWQTQVAAEISHIGGHYYWGLHIGDDSYSEAVPSDPAVNTWYCVEVLRDKTNSLATLWIDGVQKYSKSQAFADSSTCLLDGIDSYSVAASGTCYADDCAIANAYIGPIGPGSLQFSSISINTVFPGQSCLFSCLISGSNVSSYIFSTNNTGTWTNDTAIASGQTSVWANVTKTLTSNIRAVVGYKWYANNTSGNWGTSGVLTLTTSEFRTKAPLPVGASDIPGVSYNGLIYVFGGFGTSYSDRLNSVYCYNATTNSWASKANMMYAQFGAAAVVYNGIAYLFGGADGASGNRVSAYNFTSNTWTTKSNLPANLANRDYGGQMAVTVGSYIYVLFHYYIYQYNPASDTYIQKANIPAMRRWATCAYLNVGGDDRIYVIGGLDDSGGGLGVGYSTVYYYSVTHNSWTLVSGPAPYAAYGTTRDNPVINGLIYYGYGNNATSTGFYSYMYSYNPVTNTWTQLSSGNYPRDGPACAVLDTTLYIIGGRDLEDPYEYGLTYNEAYNAQTADTTPPTFGSITANTTVAGSGVNLSCTVSDNVAISSYTYSWNNTGSWANQTAVSASGSFVTATLNGTWNSTSGDTVSVKIYANDTSNNWNVSPQYDFTIISASAYRLVLTAGAGQSLTAGGLSSMITVQRQDQYGNPVTFGSINVSFGSTSAGATFYSDAGVTPALSVVIVGGSSTVNFWYVDTFAGAPVLTASASGLTPSTTTFVIASASASKLVFTAGAGQSLPAGQVSSVITVQRQDQYGNPTTSGNITIYLGSSSSAGAFYSDSGGTHQITQVNTFDGSGSASFYYSDTAAGTATLTASSSGLNSATTQFTLNAATASQLVYVAGAGQTLTAGTVSAQITVQRLDQYDNPVTSGSLTVNLASTSSGAAFYSDAGTTQVSSVTINGGSSSVSFWYKDTAVGSPTLTASAASLSSATTAFEITSASLNHFNITAISNPQTAGATFNITITATDQYGNIVTSYTGSNTLSDLSGTISPTSTSSFSGGVWAGSVTITRAYYSDIISTFGSGKSGTTNSFNVCPNVFDHFTMSSYPSSTVPGQSFNITVTAWDAFDNLVTGYVGQVYFTSSDEQAVLPYNIGSKYTFTSGDNGSHAFAGFELNTLPLQTITITDGVKSATSNSIAVMPPITPPSYSSISVSSTFAGQSCTFYAGWNDNYGLSGYIFSTNNTGLWQNTTWMQFSGVPSLVSVTQSLNSNVGAVIGYIWYANNTNGLWNNTGIQTLTTANGMSFSVISNSTVSELAFNSTSQVLEFTVSGPTGTIGFTNVTIAKTLISDVSTLRVYLNGTETNYTINDFTSFWLIYFTYNHSTHKVVMDFVSQKTKTSVTPLNGVLVAIIGLVVFIFTTLAFTIKYARKRKREFPNGTKQKR